MPNTLDDGRVAFLTANEGVEQVELTQPWRALEWEGVTPVLIAGGWSGSGPSTIWRRPTSSRSMSPSNRPTWTTYVGLVLPGGVANPDQLRMNEGAVAFARALFEAGKPVAVICHGPWTLVEALVLDGRPITSWPRLQTDVRNSGGVRVDQEVQVCEDGPNRLVSSRNSGRPAGLQPSRDRGLPRLIFLTWKKLNPGSRLPPQSRRRRPVRGTR